MCPCVVANPLVLDILFWALVILGGIGFVICMALRKLAPVAGFICLALYRWFSGATLVKDLHVEEKDMPERRYARHVHAVLRTLGTSAAVLSLLYPMFFYAFSALVVGSSIGIGINRLAQRRENQLAARKAQMVDAGEPIRVRAQVRS